MHIITGQYDTENGSKYLQQLCKHFGHKIEVEYSETKGICHFEMGDANLTADADGLTIRFELANAAHISGAKSVIDKHLRKFAFREDFTDMIWSD